MDCVLLALMAAMDPDRVPVALSVQPTHPSSQIPSRDHYRTTKIKVHAGEGSTSGGRLDDKNLPASHDREKKMHYNAMRGLSVVGPESSLLCGVWCCWLWCPF